MKSAARHEVLCARSEPGAGPEVADRVLRQSMCGAFGAADRQPRPMRGARPLRSITWSGRADAASPEAIRAVAVLMRGSA